MTLIYYAHSKLLYDTQEEKAQRKFIERTVGKVLCPNKDVGELGGIQPYLDIIKKKCTHVVCTEFLGLVGRGVWEEVKYARKLHLPILCVRKVGAQYKMYRVRTGKIVDRENWKAYAKLNCEPI